MKNLRQGNVARIVQVVLVLGAGFAFYHFYYLEQRREALHQRNLRELGSVARQLEDVLGTWSEVVANALASDPKLERTAPPAGPRGSGTSTRNPSTTNFSTTDPSIKSPPTPGRVREALEVGEERAWAQLPGARLHLLSSAEDDPQVDGEPLPWVRISPRGRVTWVSFLQEHDGRWLEVALPLSRVANRIALPEELFDHLLLLDQHGRVVLRRGDPTLRITGLDLEEPPPRHAHQTRHTLGGHTWEVFAQPVELAPGHAPAGAAVRPLTWHVMGLVDSDALEAESAALPPPVLMILVCCVFLLVLLVPIFKVWLLGRHERVRRRDLLTMAVASATAMALLAILAADLYAFGALEAAVDRNLEDLAHHLALDVRSELEAMQTQLEILVDAGLGREEGVHTRLLAEPPAAAPALEHWRYPWFEAAAWVEPDGRQKSRWTVAAEGTEPISVADRAYFRRVMSGDTWPLGTPERAPVVLEPIQSLTSGHRLAVLAMPVARWAGDGAPGAVATLAARPLTLMEPVLPVDVGFALVEPDGRVLFHSDPARNGRGNWIAACDDDPRVAQAIHRRQATALDTHYQGHPVHARFEPLSPLPLSLVVFHDRQPLNRLHLDLLLWVLAAALSLLGLLTLGAVLLAGTWFLSLGRGQWLLGSGEKFEGSDLRLVALLGLLAASLAWCLGDPELTSKLAFALALPAVAVLFFLARLVWKRSRRRRLWLEILPLGLWLILVLGDLALGLRLDAARPWRDLLVMGGLWLLASVLWLRPLDDPTDELPTRLGSWIHEGGGVVLNSLLFFVVVAALPTALVFQVLWQAEHWTLISRQQHSLALQLKARDERIAEELSETLRTLPAAEAESLRRARLEFPPDRQPWDRRHPPFHPEAETGDSPPPLIFATRVEEVPSCPVLRGTGVADDLHHRSGYTAQLLWDQLQGLHARLPLRHARSLEGEDGGPGLAGFWRADLTARGHVRLHVSSPRRSGCLHLTSSGTLPHHPGPWWTWFMVLAGLLYLGAIGLAARRLLAFDLYTTEGTTDPPPAAGWLLWVGSEETARRTFPAQADSDGTGEQLHLDLSRPAIRRHALGDGGDDNGRDEGSGDAGGDARSDARGDGPRSTVPEPWRTARRLVLLGADPFLHGGQPLVRLLAFLEDLLQEDEPPAVVLVVSAPPDVDDLLAQVATTAADGSGGPWPPSRVLDVLASFVVYSTDRLGIPRVFPGAAPEPGVCPGSPPTAPPTAPLTAPLIAELGREAGTHPHLQRIAALLSVAPGLARGSRRRRLKAFRNAAELYYRWLWSRTRKEERRVLFQLAEEDLVNPAVQDTARRLVRRGLAEYVPHRGLRSLNQTFRTWVCRRAEEEDLHRLEQAPGGWAQARRPLMVALLAVLVFLLSTQKDLLGDTLGDLQRTLVQSVAAISAVLSALIGLRQFLPLGGGGGIPALPPAGEPPEGKGGGKPS